MTALASANRALFFLLGLALAAWALLGCATTRGQGCDRIHDPEAPAGFTVYVCPHPFAVADEGWSPTGVDGRLPPGSVRWVYGVTSCETRTIAVWDRFSEVLAHEYRHARACSTGGGRE